MQLFKTANDRTNFLKLLLSNSSGLNFDTTIAGWNNVFFMAAGGPRRQYNYFPDD